MNNTRSIDYENKYHETKKAMEEMNKKFEAKLRDKDTEIKISKNRTYEHESKIRELSVYKRFYDDYFSKVAKL